MTSEVALLNRSAVALAADSAATVTYWDADKDKQEQRYFKRANKIFNIVSGKPVGLMTYAAGSLHGIPWEVLAKAYRDARVGTSFPQLAGYAQDLFRFLEGHADIFPASEQEQYLKALVSEMVTKIGAEVIFNPDFTAEKDAKKRSKLASDLIKNAEDNIRRDSYINDDSKAIYEEVKKNTKEIREHIWDTDSGKYLLSKLDKNHVVLIADVAIESVFKSNWTPLEYTGIVVAGYGEQQFLPQLEQFKVFGIVRGKLICNRVADGCTSITVDNSSQIVPIAQSNMINTFRLGADIGILQEIDGLVGRAIQEFADELAAGGHLQGNVNLDPIKLNAAKAFKDRLRDYIWREHGRPLRQVIGMLSPEELAELAETFVSAESLKERVTRPTETVSGPVDVAVITKGDGFIWIKRKHYFDPKLNPRFLAKKQQEIQE